MAQQFINKPFVGRQFKIKTNYGYFDVDYDENKGMRYSYVRPKIRTQTVWTAKLNGDQVYFEVVQDKYWNTRDRKKKCYQGWWLTSHADNGIYITGDWKDASYWDLSKNRMVLKGKWQSSGQSVSYYSAKYPFYTYDKKTNKYKVCRVTLEYCDNREKVQELMQRNQRLQDEEEKNRRDDLCGLLMKKDMYSLLNALCAKNEKNAWLLSTDMDNMHALNEKYGKIKVDNIIIRKIGLILADFDKIRNISAFRKYGYEFFLVIRNLSKRDVHKIAETLRSRVERETVARLSIGGAILNKNESRQDWEDRAEDMMKVAKKYKKIGRGYVALQ